MPLYQQMNRFDKGSSPCPETTSELFRISLDFPPLRTSPLLTHIYNSHSTFKVHHTPIFGAHDYSRHLGATWRNQHVVERDVDSERQARDEAGADVDGGEGRGLGEVDGGGQCARLQLDHQRDGRGDDRDGGQVQF